jgi:circadian clock protein KaiC
MQFLVHGVRQCKEPGIFVAFEESPQRIIANFKTFGWQLETLIPKMLFFMDAQLTTDFLQAGDFDLSGMLASLGSLAKTMRARRIVLDALDVILAHLPDAVSRRREVYRIHDWLLSSGLTGVITAKSASDDKDIHGVQPFGFVQFMVDCAVELNHRMIYGVSQRNLRVQKYRGSSFDENESPFVISKDGFDVSTARPLVRTGMPVTTERVSSGV